MTTFLRVGLILSLFVFCNVNANNKVAPEPITSSLSPNITVTPTTPSTTVSTTTTKPPQPTNGTTVPTTTTPTTTASPKTTTPTTRPTTTSGTTASTTTTTPTSPTTISPSTTPAPEPKQGTWSVTDKNTTCIQLTMAANIETNYTSNANKTLEGHVFLPDKVNVTGKCGETEQFIQLQWLSSQLNKNNTMNFTFKKSDDKFDLASITVSVVLDQANFPDAKNANQSLTLRHEKKNDFPTPIKMSYTCAKLQLGLNTTEVNSTRIGSIQMTKLQFQAFGNIINSKFGEAKDCTPYETPDIVPIAVGCALMALIIIVLIGYLVGRRRNQARGYLSM